MYNILCKILLDLPFTLCKLRLRRNLSSRGALSVATAKITVMTNYRAFRIQLKMMRGTEPVRVGRL